MTVVLGISAFYHDSSAALLRDGKIVAAAQEERFTRLKHDARYPRHAIDYCLREAGLQLKDVEAIVFYEKPFLKFERLLETYVAVAPRGLRSFMMSIPVWLREKLFQKRMMIDEFARHDGSFIDSSQLKFCEHHFSHCASAFYPSPFEEAVVLTLDGVGEWATSSVALGKGNDLKIVKEMRFPHSLGLLYSAFTYYIGFRVNSGEYKLMGLAPYGRPKYVDVILENLIDVKEDGSFWLDQRYFDYATGLTMTNQRFSDLFGQPVRKPDVDEITQFHMDIAASVQAVCEDVVLKLATSLRDEFDCPNLCLAGGVALNCVANGKLLRSGVFDNIWVQPAAGDAGGALGAALAYWHQQLGNPRTVAGGYDDMAGSYLGPQFSNDEIKKQLSDVGAVCHELNDDALFGTVATALSQDKAIGWFDGRMEFGPRALGARSILANPQSPIMQKNLNLKIKFRESFRPFAPSVLEGDVASWFNLDVPSPYMLIVSDVVQEKRRTLSDRDQSLFGIDQLNVARSDIPAVTHVDYSARVQTVSKTTNPRYHRLISKFKQMTGCPVLVNTSFNVRGEPIVGSPEDAFRCFMGTDIDMLVCGNIICIKDQQNPSLAEDYRNKYKLD